MTLNVLVLESERGAADAAIADLGDAGHNVLRCHEPDAAAFPCNALASGRQCPMRDAVVDVALTVRPRPRSQPAPQEDGVRCALQAHVPLVVAGPEVLDPYAAYAAEIVPADGDLVAACERAAVAPLPEHGAVARDAMRAVFDLHGAPMTGARVDVRRRHGSLHVEVHGAADVDHVVKSIASVRMIGALRALDRDAHGIDVVFAA